MKLNDLSTDKLVGKMFAFSKNAYDAVQRALPDIAELTETVINVIENGGCVFYIGAGTSGRIGTLDASEIPPTFGEYNLFIPIIAGGVDALVHAKEFVEDYSMQGKEDLKSAGFTERDIAIGISASGNTPYVLGALKHAHTVNGETALLSCKKTNYPFINHLVVMEAGEEFIKGSTRLNAGTAQKLALNMISTIAMIKLGRTFDNLMVAVVPTNGKLIKRAADIVSEIAGVPVNDTLGLVKKTKDARIAILMAKKGLSEVNARALLKKYNNNFVKAYES